MKTKECKLITLKKFSEKHEWPSYRALLRMNKTKEKNGLNTAFVRFNNRFLVDEEEFFKCIRNSGMKNEK